MKGQISSKFGLGIFKKKKVNSMSQVHRPKF